MQSIDSLRELNAKLLAEITELRKENAEIPELREKLLKFEAENGELKAINVEILIPDLRRKISEFDAERAELKHRIAEALRMTEEERTRRDAENAKLKVRIKELEFEFRDRITKVPMVTHHEKPLVDTLLPEDKEMNAFLDEVHKKKDSSSTTRTAYADDPSVQTVYYDKSRNQLLYDNAESTCLHTHCHCPSAINYNRLIICGIGVFKLTEEYQRTFESLLCSWIDPYHLADDPIAHRLLHQILIRKESMKTMNKNIARK
ncbi:5155_t:CDS:2, partial [Paraglomus occultum]